ncbi:MAG TPA: ankyrin repeat domain-containing protein, partial [Desulfomonilaceae bacterium]|nr:ankyrin repeat domain-containing protein [Desulfomonilaceae bacterium]
MKTERISGSTKRGLAFVLVLALLTWAGNASADAGLDQQITQAAKSGDLALVKTLVEKGANVNAKGVNGRTPLMCATLEGHPKIVRLLINRGADINARDQNGETPLMQAADQCDLDMLHLLLDKGANVDLDDEDGETALIRVARADAPPDVRLLVEKGADIKANARKDRAGLEWDDKVYADMAKLLLGKGANVNAKDR